MAFRSPVFPGLTILAKPIIKHCPAPTYEYEYQKNDSKKELVFAV